MELLVAVVVFTLIGVAMVSTLRSGVVTWRRVNTTGDVRQELQFVLNRMARDLTSAVPVSTPIFDPGGQQIVTSNTWTDDRAIFTTVLADTVGDRRLHRIAYTVEDQDGTAVLLRAITLHPRDPLAVGAIDVLLEGIDALVLSYRVYDPDADALLTYDLWPPPEHAAEIGDALPSVVAVTLTVERGEEIYTVSRLVPVPLDGARLRTGS